MTGDLRAETIKQGRRPANWLLLAVAAVLTLTFAYLIPYAGLDSAASGAPSSARGLDGMLPAQFIGNAIAGTPIFAGALALVFGVLVVGSEFGFETWKTVLVQGSSRVTVYGAKLAIVAGGIAVLVLTMAGVGALASAGVAMLEDQPLDWPSVADMLRGLGSGWLVAMTWAALGVLLAVVLRGVALPIGLGLVWLLAVQNLLTAIAAPLLDWVAEAQKGLPGPNAGSLVASMGAPSDTPGVAVLVDSSQAALVLSGYLIAFAALGGWLLTRRDIG